MMNNCLTSFFLVGFYFVGVIFSVSSNQQSGSTPTESQLENISLLLYTGKTIDEYITVSVDNATNLIDQMNPNKPTVVYIFGWHDTPSSPSVRYIVNAYLKRQDHNVILANWEEIAAEFYLAAVIKVNSVGSRIAEMLNTLVAAGLDPTTLHIVSHSLGSQVAGFVGRMVNFTLVRITGLDPAGTGFTVLMDGLSSADAEFVDVIHTDAGFYGTVLSVGNIDFYPNGGTRFQPGCPFIRIPLISIEDFCDHQRSWHYYAESLLNEDAFVGLTCSSYIFYALGFCNSNKRVVMGYGTPTTANGSVYLRINSESPYGLGDKGLE